MFLDNSFADILNYQIFSYSEFNNPLPSTDVWKKLDDVRALPLPMACSLSHVIFSSIIS